MKNLIATLIALVSIAMVSCSSNEEMFEYSQNNEAAAQASSNETKAMANFTDSAYVRLGMYAAVQGYDLQVVDMWFESNMGPTMLPTFGQNIVNNGILPTTKNAAIYDQANGAYNNVIPTYEGTDITVHFNVVMTGANGVGGKITLNNVTYTITSDRTAWDEGCHYNYVIGLTPEVLGLNPIMFNAGVEDWANSNDANC